MESLHSIFLNTYLRFPTISEMEPYSDATSFDYLRNTLLTTIEGQICLLVKRYEGVDVDISEFTLMDVDTAMTFMDYIRDIFSRYLFKVPLISDYIYAFTLLKLYGIQRAQDLVKAYVLDQNEHKYIEQCLQKFLEWPTVPTLTPSTTAIKVRYYGPIGTSGYAIAARDIVRSLYASPDFDIEFVPISVQNFSNDDASNANKILNTCCKAQTTQDLFESSKLEPVDIVFLHSFCDLWIPIVKREKRANANTLVIGVTVWESDAIPPQWIPHLRWVDAVSVPNRWNKQVIARDVPGVSVSFVPHPVLDTDPSTVVTTTTNENQSLLDLQSLKDKNDAYIFYTINEFSGRKGIDLLIRSFVEEFSDRDNVILFIKTHGSVSKTIGSQFLAYTLNSRTNACRIVLDYDRWSDEEIERLHSLGDCYVSLTRSEGHGLAACHAGIRGKHVIMTRYGGQVDYLTGISWVSARSTPAFHCSPCDNHHQQCKSLPSCKDFPFFIAAQQNWGDPDTLQAKELMRKAFEERLRGEPRTISYLRRFDETCTSKIWYQYAQYTLQHKYHVPYPRAGLANTYDMPPQRLLPLSNFVHTKEPMFSNRPKVLLIGSWQYGNFGDDSYYTVHEHMMKDRYDIFFCNTTTYIDKNGIVQPLSKYTEGDVMDVDHVVVGGGGLINSGELKSSIFKVYHPYCTANNKPLSFVSVGVAFPSVPNETARALPENARLAWSAVLESAEMISVRSYADREAVKTLIPPERHHRLRVASDIVYGLPSIYKIPESDKKFVVYIPTNFMCLTFPDVALYIQEQLLRFPGSRLVMIAMDGISGDGLYPAKLIREEARKVQALFPNSIILPGRYYWGATRRIFEERHHTSAQEYSDQTPAKVVSILKKAHCIISGRYHGVVMARALGVPLFVGTCSLHKIQQELREDLNTSTWKNHYQHLFVAIDRCFQMGKRVDPSSWDEDRRNTIITDIVTNSKSSAPFVQNMTNEQLSYSWDNVVLQWSDKFCT